LYLRSIGIENIYSISDAHRYKIQSIFKKAIQTFNDKKEKEYLENIMSFINTCISWKPNNKKFTKLEIDIFFRERNIKTSGIIKEIFRNKLNEKLQDI
jgi:predicted GTPase